jgi:SPP1 family predicted phage head-tail adaptor
VSEERIPSLGTLTDRVQLRRKVTTSSAAGGELAVFTPLGTVWARVRRLGTRQAFDSDARGQAISHSVAMRFRTDLRPGDRIVYRGHDLEIAAVSDINGRRAYVSCACVERAVTA